MPPDSVDQVGAVVDECSVAFAAVPTALAHFSKPKSRPAVTMLYPWPERLTPIRRAFAQMEGAPTSTSGANLSDEEVVGAAARTPVEPATSRRRRSDGVSSIRAAAGNAPVSRVTELIGNSGRLLGFHDDETDSEGDLDLQNPTEAGVSAAATGVNDGWMSELVQSGALSGKDAIFLKLAEKMLTRLDGASSNAGGNPSDTLAIDPSHPFRKYGLKAVMDLHRLADLIKFRPVGIYNGLYSEATDEMCVEKGEPLNMDKHRRSVNFGK